MSIKDSPDFNRAKAIYSYAAKEKGNTFLNRRLDLRASRIEASVLFTSDFPLILLCCDAREFDTPTNFNCSRICEIILQTFTGVADSSRNLSRNGMCSASITLTHDNAMLMTLEFK